MPIRKKNKPIFLLLEIYSNLPPKYKWRTFFLFIFMLLAGLLEFLTIGLLFPFLEFISNGNTKFENNSISNSDVTFNLINNLHQNFIGLLLLGFVILASIFKIYIYWKSGRLSASIGNKLASETFKGLLHRNYEEFIYFDTSKLISTITLQVTKSAATIDSILRSICSIVLLIFILFSLIILNPILTISLSIFLALTYTVIVKFTKNKLKRTSYAITNQQKISLKYVKESLSGFRDIKINQSENFFLKNFKSSDEIMRMQNAYSTFLDSFPKFTIELLIISLVIFIAMFFPVTADDKFLLPTLGVFGFASQKLLPSIQQIYVGWARLNNTQSDLENVTSLLNFRKNNKRRSLLNQTVILPKKQDIVFNKLELKGVGYKYPSNGKQILKNINLIIEQGDIIGIKGISGGGKTTLVDLISGLLEPNDGEVLFNGKSLFAKENQSIRKDWLSTISYVPQSIFISDQPVYKNVAFGIQDDLIDFDRVIKCLQMAQLSNFADTSSDIFENKNIGDDGNRISGGQRQRIGIARALYRKSNLLILDEATSSLDLKTENEIVNLISTLSEKITIIMVAHRLSTLNICNKKFELNEGQMNMFT